MGDIVRIKGNPKRRIPFELENSDGDVEKFSVRGIAGWAFLEMAGLLASSEDETPEQRIRQEARQAAELVELFRDAIGDPEMFERFRSHVRNPDNGITLVHLQELIEHLSKETTQRPTEPSSQSPRGRSKTAATS